MALAFFSLLLIGMANATSAYPVFDVATRVACEMENINAVV